MPDSQHSDVTVAGAVLLTQQHLPYFHKDLIPNLRFMSSGFDELLVIASGLRSRSLGMVKSDLDTLHSHSKLNLIVAPLGSVGANRNRAVAVAKSELVAFLDADDLYSSDYVRFIRRAFTEKPFDVLLHGYESMALDARYIPLLDSVSSEGLPPRFATDDFVANPHEDWFGDPNKLLGTSLRFAEEKVNHQIHQGHMTISKAIPLSFHEDPHARNEDGVFLQQCLLERRVVHFYPLKLSAYRDGSSANPMKYRLARKWRQFSRGEIFRSRQTK